MLHSKTRIWIHGILGVKNREKLITEDIEKEIFDLLKTKLLQLNCSVKSINGTRDHIHVLFLLNSKIAVSDVIKQIKDSVYHEINQRKLTQNRFSWRTGFGAFSVSESNLDRTLKYIQNQKDIIIRRCRSRKTMIGLLACMELGVMCSFQPTT